MLHGIRVEPPLDVRELVVQRTSTAAVHDQENRPTPDQIQANYAIDDTLRDPVPQLIGLFDDVLTTGAHYRAALAVLQFTANLHTAMQMPCRFFGSAWQLFRF